MSTYTCSRSLEDMHADGSDRSPYEHWFGDWDTEGTIFRPYRPRDHVKAMYGGIRPFDTAGDQGGYTYDCDCDRNIMAYVTIGESVSSNFHSSQSFIITIHCRYNEAPENPLIHLCRQFRSERTEFAGGTDTKAGALIHEATHFPFVRPYTEDFAYGVKAAHSLRLDPFMAIRNADSYEFFAEGLYKPSMDEITSTVKLTGT